MNGGGDQDALSQTGGLLENGMGDKIAGFFIHQDIFPAPWRDVKRAGADHIVKSIGVYACGIYDGPAFILRIGCLNPITVWYSGSIVSGRRFLGYTFHFCLKAELYPVFKGIFRQSDGHFEGTDNAACGRIEHGVYLFGKIGFDFVDFLSLHDAKAGNAVRNAALIQLFQPSDLILGKAEDQGAVSFEGKIQLPGKSVHHPVSLHVQPGLPGSGNCVESRVDDGAVGL